MRINCWHDSLDGCCVFHQCWSCPPSQLSYWIWKLWSDVRSDSEPLEHWDKEVSYIIQYWDSVTQLEWTHMHVHARRCIVPAKCLRGQKVCEDGWVSGLEVGKCCIFQTPKTAFSWGLEPLSLCFILCYKYVYFSAYLSIPLQLSVSWFLF